MADVDVIVVGAGHNGLACAAYLARAGRRVLVLEARGEVGGCASTVDALGTRVNICNCDHTMVLAGGVIEDLDLARYGLRYLDVDPVGTSVSWDATLPPFVQWRDVGRTVAGLAELDPAAARAYERYVRRAMPAARLLLEVQRARPLLPDLASAALRRRLAGSATLLRWARSSVLEVMDGLDLPRWITSAVATTGPAVWGLPPDAPGTGLAALGPVIRHLVGVGRPVGGSGALPAALAAAATAHGAELRCRTPVSGIEVRDGRAVAVRTAGGERIAAPVVVTAVDPRTVVLDWLDGVPGAARLRTAYGSRTPGEGYEAKLDAVLASAPLPRALAALPETVLPAAARGIATTVVSPSPAQQIASAVALREGSVSDPPMFLVNVPSVLDETMRPSPGEHLLSLEVLWTPYRRTGGWDDPAVGERWLEQLAGLCEPGLLDGVRRWRVVTPRDYEDDFGLARGYAPSFPGSVLATLLGRQRELSRYRTSIGGLFLTGAGTFPGAGVWGVSGRNAAATVLAERPISRSA